MVDLRELLNKVKWTGDLSKIRVWYVHRGAPNNKKQIPGDRIVSIEKASFRTKHSSIPYHRVVLVVYDDEVLFDRMKL